MLHYTCRGDGFMFGGDYSSTCQSPLGKDLRQSSPWIIDFWSISDFFSLFFNNSIKQEIYKMEVWESDGEEDKNHWLVWGEKRGSRPARDCTNVAFFLFFSGKLSESMVKTSLYIYESILLSIRDTLGSVDATSCSFERWTYQQSQFSGLQNTTSTSSFRSWKEEIQIYFHVR